MYAGVQLPPHMGGKYPICGGAVFGNVAILKNVKPKTPTKKNFPPILENFPPILPPLTMGGGGSWIPDLTVYHITFSLLTTCGFSSVYSGVLVHRHSTQAPPGTLLKTLVSI